MNLRHMTCWHTWCPKVIILFVCGAQSGSAAVPSLKLVPSDPRDDDRFGMAVATDGKTVIVGNDPVGFGAAYLFDARTGQQIAKLQPSNPQLYDSIAESVAVDGTKAIISARDYAFIYDFSDPLNIDETRLQPDEGPVHYFGVRVDISGDTAIVGANGEDRLGSFTGAAYLFEASSGQQLAKLTASDAQAFDNFGLDVSIDGHTAVVGAPLATVGGERNGVVYQFAAARGATIGQQVAAYSIPGPRPYAASFGYSLDISGDKIIAVEAYGLTYLWSTGGTPAHLAHSNTNHWIADAVSIDGELAVMGDFERELANLYRTTDGQFLGRFLRPEGLGSDYGMAAAVGKNVVVVGAPRADGRGAVYVYFVPEPASIGIAGSALAVLWLGLSRRCNQK
jgi:hypothetical protein